MPVCCNEAGALLQVVLDGMVDVDFGNYSTTPSSIDTNADAQVRHLQIAIQKLILNLNVCRQKLPVPAYVYLNPQRPWKATAQFCQANLWQFRF